MNYVRLFGILAFLCLIATVILGHLAMKGKVNMKWHATLAGITILFGLIHLLLVYI